MPLLRQQRGVRVDLRKNPMLAALLRPLFAGAQVRRGEPQPKKTYARLDSAAFEELDAENQEHVRACLCNYAREHRCAVSSLGWSVSSARVNSMHLVLIRPWAEVERAAQERKCLTKS